MVNKSLELYGEIEEIIARSQIPRAALGILDGAVENPLEYEIRHMVEREGRKVTDQKILIGSQNIDDLLDWLASLPQ